MARIDRAWAVVPLLVCICYYSPLVGTGDLATPNDDWQLFVGIHRTVWKAVAEFGQLPNWSPYHEGGYPLGAHPECGFPSPLML